MNRKKRNAQPKPQSATAKPEPEPEPPQTGASPSMRVTRAAAKRAAESSGSASRSAPERKAKKAKGAGNKGKQKMEDPEPEREKDETKKTTIVIEHCNHCKLIKERANQLKEVLKQRVPGIPVIMNPEKPRRGCFEISVEQVEKVTSLMNMKRPFQPMKDLDMDKIISDITDKI